MSDPGVCEFCPHAVLDHTEFSHGCIDCTCKWLPADEPAPAPEPAPEPETEPEPVEAPEPPVEEQVAP